jgi:dihydrofolate synthase/folylpolyglutamate synthase
MDFRQSVNYIQGFTDYEVIPGIAYTAANYDLRRMEKLLYLRGNPHLEIRTVHIAGTKGKGSTAAMVTGILSAAGYRTGLFTSPHLHTIRERIRINGTLITEDEFAAIVTALKPAVEEVNKEAGFGMLTTFEILTAVVFDHFKKQNVDIQVLETGLGGRLDATNVVSPDVCVITSISLDHTAILGNTLAEIAGEKAGIIKPGCTVISAPQKKEAAEIIARVCRKRGATLLRAGTDITWQGTGGDIKGQSFTLHSSTADYSLTIPLIGEYQIENAAAAVAAIEALSEKGIHISRKAIEQGLQKVDWPGRLQVLKEHPCLLIDGAHNGYSIKKLIEAIQQNFTYSRCVIIFGTSSDKDIEGMVRELRQLDASIIITHSSHPRAASTALLKDHFARNGMETEETESVQQALDQAMKKVGRDDLILVTGSLFIVADMLKYIAA